MAFERPGSGPGHKIRIVGGRKYNQRPSETIIAKKGKWILIAVPEWHTADGWFSFKVFVDDKRYKKRLWQAGVRQGKIAREKWIKELMQPHKGLFDWATTQMRYYERDKIWNASREQNNGR